MTFTKAEGDIRMELAHRIIEAAKSQALQSASWRPCGSSPKASRLETQGEPRFSSSPKAGQTLRPAQGSQTSTQGRASLSVLLRPPADGRGPPTPGGAICFIPFTDSMFTSSRHTQRCCLGTPWLSQDDTKPAITDSVFTVQIERCELSKNVDNRKMK